MKKCLSLLLAVLLLAGAALAEGMMPVNTPITIDGVRVAFFDTEGNYLQPMEKEGLLWVPLNALCENLGKTAQVQGQSIMMDGVRIGMFDEAGNFLMPQEVNGTVYVPAVAFCQSAGISVEKTEQGVAITRAAEAPAVQADPAPAATAAPMYGYVPVTEVNFLDFFTVRTGHSIYEGQNVTITYYAECDANTSYGLENVQFTLNGFGNIPVPASGHAEASYKETIYTGARNTKDSILKAADAKVMATLKSFSLTGASGKLRMSYQEAEALKKEYYEKAKGYLELGAYSNAVRWYELLAGIDYLDSKALLKEARSKKAAADKAAAEAAAKKKEEENQKKYAAAQALLAEGKYDEAIKAFEALKNYKDSAAKVEEAKTAQLELVYADAMKAMEEERWQDAISRFAEIKDYKDSADRITACENAKKLIAYNTAEKLEEQGDYVAAYDGFLALGDFEDSALRAEKLLFYKNYSQAESLAAEGKYDKALKLLQPVAYEEKAQALIRTCNLRNMLMPKAFGKSGVALFYGNILGESRLVAGLIDCQGNIVKPLGHLSYDQAEAWCDGLHRQESNGLYGYMDARGEWAIQPQYSAATVFYEGRALVTLNGQQLVIDEQGQAVSKLPVKAGRSYYEYVGEGIVSFQENNMWGLVDLSGKEVLKAKYKCVTSPFVSKQGISRFRYGLAVVQDESKKETRYGVINLKGKEVLKLGKFSSPTVLTDNLIGVHSNKSYYDAQIIDLKGKKKWSGVAGDFYRQGDLIIFNGSSKEYKYGALNLDLKEAVPFDYDDLKVGYESKVVALQRGEAWSVYSTDDLSKPLIDRPITAVTVSTDSPFVGFYNKNSVQGWFLYDCRNHQIH